MKISAHSSIIGVMLGGWFGLNEQIVQVVIQVGMTMAYDFKCYMLYILVFQSSSIVLEFFGEDKSQVSQNDFGLLLVL